MKAMKVQGCPDEGARHLREPSIVRSDEARSPVWADPGKEGKVPGGEGA